MTLHALLFDVDGTLADTERDGHRPAFNQAFADAASARRYAVKNLIFARQIGLLPLLLYTFLQSARIILTENKMDEYGLALLGLVVDHPASNFDTRQALGVAIDHLGLDVSDPGVSEGMETGKSLDIGETVNTLLNRFKE